MNGKMWIISALYVFLIVVILILSIIVASKSVDARSLLRENESDTTTTIVNSLEQLTIENDSMLNILQSTNYTPIENKDTITIHDTLFIKIEERLYKMDTIVNKDDTIHYEMLMQGYKLDLLNYKFKMITTNSDTTIQIKTKQKDKKWSIGLQLGAGVGYSNNQFNVTPYIGLGLTYSLFSW